MKFIADEGVDAQIVSKLRSEGYDVLYIAEFDAGANDDDILKFANEDDRILITRDKDFGELVFRLNKIHSGIVLNRLFQLDSSRKAALVLKVVNQYKEQLYGSYTVIQPGRIRVRNIK